MIFLLGVFPTQLIRHKVKMLTHPTRHSRFPFKAALRESPTTYLAHKATRESRCGGGVMVGVRGTTIEEDRRGSKRIEEDRRGSKRIPCD